MDVDSFLFGAEADAKAEYGRRLVRFTAAAMIALRLLWCLRPPTFLYWRATEHSVQPGRSMRSAPSNLMVAISVSWPRVAGTGNQIGHSFLNIIHLGESRSAVIIFWPRHRRPTNRQPRFCQVQVATCQSRTPPLPLQIRRRQWMSADCAILIFETGFLFGPSSI